MFKKAKDKTEVGRTSAVNLKTFFRLLSSSFQFATETPLKPVRAQKTAADLWRLPIMHQAHSFEVQRCHFPFGRGGSGAVTSAAGDPQGGGNGRRSPASSDRKFGGKKQEEERM